MTTGPDRPTQIVEDGDAVTFQASPLLRDLLKHVYTGYYARKTLSVSQALPHLFDQVGQEMRSVVEADLLRRFRHMAADSGLTVLSQSGPRWFAHRYPAAPQIFHEPVSDGFGMFEVPRDYVFPPQYFPVCKVEGIGIPLFEGGKL